MILRLLFLIAFSAAIWVNASCQDIRGLWLIKTECSAEITTDCDELSYCSQYAGLLDFYDDSNFLYYYIDNNHIYGSYKKISKGYQMQRNDKRRGEIIVTFIKDNLIKVETNEKQKHNRKIYFCERVKESNIQISYDSLTKFFGSHYWELSMDSIIFSNIEFQSKNRDTLRIVSDVRVSEVWWELIDYKKKLFLLYIGDNLLETNIFQINQIKKDCLISNIHNYRYYNCESEDLLIKKIPLPEKETIERFSAQLSGQWRNEYTYHVEKVYINESFFINLGTLAEKIRVDSVLSNTINLSLYIDSTFVLVNEGSFLSDSKEININDSINGIWKLSKTLDYIELVTKNIESYYNPRFIVINDFEKDSLKITMNFLYNVDIMPPVIQERRIFTKVPNLMDK